MGIGALVIVVLFHLLRALPQFVHFFSAVHVEQPNQVDKVAWQGTTWAKQNKQVEARQLHYDGAFKGRV